MQQLEERAQVAPIQGVEILDERLPEIEVGATYNVKYFSFDDDTLNKIDINLMITRKTEYFVYGKLLKMNNSPTLTISSRAVREKWCVGDVLITTANWFREIAKKI